jgi:hypothetical protein
VTASVMMKANLSWIMSRWPSRACARVDLGVGSRYPPVEA